MPNSLKFFCVSALGVLTAVLVAAANAIIAYFWGFNVFSMSFLVLVPVGAFAVGIAATSGYYLGCVSLQLRPGILLFAQMVVVAALTNLLIHYFEYLTVVMNDRPDLVTSVDGFTTYLSYYLGHQQMSIGRPSMSVGEIGEFGYVLAVIDFVGFLAGGFAGILFLRGAQTCKACNLYYQRVAKKKRPFESRYEVARYYDGLFSLPPDGPEFAARAALKGRRGPYMVMTTLFQCPQCKGQLWQDEVWEGSSKLGELKRSKVMPAGLDVTPLLRSKGAPPKEGAAETAAPTGQT